MAARGRPIGHSGRTGRAGLLVGLEWKSRAHRLTTRLFLRPASRYRSCTEPPPWRRDVGMSAGAAVIDFEITRKLSELAVPDASSALVLFRLHGRPLGWGAGRVTDGRLDGDSLVRQFVRQHAWTCALPLAERAIQSGRPLRMPDATT